jgi:sec-independent protein translocase protein TatA
MFGNIGLPELMVIMAIALLVFGPKKLPEVGRTIGKAIREFKRSTDEIKDKFEEQIRAEEFKSLQDDIKKDLREADIRKDLIEDGENKKISG